MSACVAVVGTSAVHVELVKNLVLAGVGKVVILDDGLVTEEDLGYNFFLSSESLGKPRGSCAAAKAQEMNPLIQVTSAPEASLEAIPYNIICVPMSYQNWSLSALIDLNDRCRAAGRGFFVSGGAADSAWLFSDLGMHTVREFTQKPSEEDAPARGPEEIAFPSLRDFLSCPLSDTKWRKIPGAVAAFALLLKFRQKNGISESLTADQVAFSEFAISALQAAKVPAPLLAELNEEKLQQFFCRTLTQPFVFTSAILSGVLGQEVIKGLTKRDIPLVNTVTVAGASATIMSIPPTKPISNPPMAAAVEMKETVQPIQPGESIELD